MDRKEAIRIGINCLDDYGLQRGDTNKIKALETLLSTVKLVEEVVGKVIDEIKHIEKHHKPFTIDDEYYRGARNTYKEILTLLTEGE